jgi:Flp pilus assembly protein TadD
MEATMRSIPRLKAVAAVIAVFCSARAASAVPATARDLQRSMAACSEGTRLLVANDVAKAKESFTKALTFVPTYPDGHLGMGHVLLREGKFQEALDEYMKARDGYQELGEALLDIQAKRFNDTQRTIATLRDNVRNLQSSQTQNSTRADPSRIDREIATTEDQIRRLEAVQMPMKDKPTEAPGEIYFHMGNAQLRLDRVDDAIASWETCAQKSPTFSMVQNNLAVAYWKKGRFDDARRALARATELGFPVNPQFKADLEKAAAAAGAGGAPANPPPPSKP